MRSSLAKFVPNHPFGMVATLSGPLTSTKTTVTKTPLGGKRYKREPQGQSVAVRTSHLQRALRTRLLASLLGTRTLLGAKGIATSGKEATTPGVATRSKDATRGSGHRY